MKKTIIVLTVILCNVFISCKEYYEDLQAIGTRVEVLEDSTLTWGETMRIWDLLAKTVQTNGYITAIDELDDGSCTIHMRGDFNGDGELTDSLITIRNGTKGSQGEDGKELSELLTVKKDIDNRYYWWFGDNWLWYNNKQVPVQGEDGTDATSAVVEPKLRYVLVDITDPLGPYKWQVSYDGGKTYSDLYQKDKDGNYLFDEDGKLIPVYYKGEKGEPGEPGVKDPVLINIIDMGASVMFVYYNSNTGQQDSVIVPKNT